MSKRALIATVAVVLAPHTARAGESLTIEENVQLAHGGAVVRVDLTRDREPGAVEVIRVLRGLPADTKASPAWLGLCLPRKKVLRDWTIQHRKWPAAALWRRALARGHYQAVVLVEKYEGGYRPRCGVEAMQMLHTDVNEGFAKYTSEVEDVLQRRAAGKGP